MVTGIPKPKLMSKYRPNLRLKQILTLTKNAIPMKNLQAKTRKASSLNRYVSLSLLKALSAIVDPDLNLLNPVQSKLVFALMVFTNLRCVVDNFSLLHRIT
jgi:hypothetical protein